MTVVCITTRNEQDTIASLVYALRGLGNRVVIVDAASTDETVERARAAGADVLAYKERISIAMGMMLAWELALAKHPDAVVQMDAGGSHQPADLPYLVAGLARAGLVVGSRFAPGASYRGRGWRALASRAYGWASGLPVRDCTSGFRAYRPGLLRALLGHSYVARMHSWQTEVLHTALYREGANVVEVPIRYRAGASSFSWKVAKEALNTLWRLR